MPEIKKKGRPEKEEGTQGKTYGFRLTDDIINDIDSMADDMTKKTGFNIDRSNLVRKAIVDLIYRYKAGENIMQVGRQSSVEDR